MKTCALPFCPFGIMYEGVGDLASQSSPVNKVTSLVSGSFAFSGANTSTQLAKSLANSCPTLK